MFTNGFKHARRLAPVLAVAAIGLAACGGGGEDGFGGPEYVSWQNNANDTVILDWNNDRYAVRISFDDGHDTGLYSWDLLYDLGRDKDEKLRIYRETLRLRALRDEA